MLLDNKISKTAPRPKVLQLHIL